MKQIRIVVIIFYLAIYMICTYTRAFRGLNSIL